MRIRPREREAERDAPIHEVAQCGKEDVRPLIVIPPAIPEDDGWPGVERRGEGGIPLRVERAQIDARRKDLAARRDHVEDVQRAIFWEDSQQARQRFEKLVAMLHRIEPDLVRRQHPIEVRQRQRDIPLLPRRQRETELVCMEVDDHARIAQPMACHAEEGGEIEHFPRQHEIE